MTVELVKPAEVLEPGQRTLRELADEANREHDFALEAGLSMLDHAIHAGEALLAARRQCKRGGWTAWVEEYFAGSEQTATNYTRLAEFQDEARRGSNGTINGALRHLTITGAIRVGGPGGMPEPIKEEIRRLRGEGLSPYRISRELGLSDSSVRRLDNPEYLRRERDKQRMHREKRIEARKAREQQQREQAIKRAVRKAGAALAEAYTRAERDQDIIAQAQREATDTETKRLLSEAGAVQRKYRDLIVRALGVS